MFDGNRYTERASRYYGLLPDKTEIPASALLLELRTLTKSVPGGRVLFRDLSLNVQPGELVSIVNSIQGRICSAPNRTGQKRSNPRNQIR